ncbi:MAG: hypothetical protein EOO08_01600 [Chitinophagaceae bacterium]|nr:MAG: hypothetical protein EOO08_01600 [Chitinophagaceae bacterium]
MGIVFIIVLGIALIALQIWGSRLKGSSQALYRIAGGVLLLLMTLLFPDDRKGLPHYSLLILGCASIIWGVIVYVQAKRDAVRK